MFGISFIINYINIKVQSFINVQLATRRKLHTISPWYSTMQATWNRYRDKDE